MHDLVLVGGGLANGLIALRLKTLRPELNILLLEQGPTLGGNHTWSFYGQDLAPAQLDWVLPLAVNRWPGYEVRFPGHRRELDTTCHSISSERFHEVLTRVLGGSVRFNATVNEIHPGTVRVDGEMIQAHGVIDGRGPAPSPHMACAYQKFVGQELVLAAPHGQSAPVIMDATVAQYDGYRFVYTLPMSDRRILVEDTYYSNSPTLDVPALRSRIDQYVARHGWQVAEVAREETGVLPIALDGDMDAFWHEAVRTVPCSGLRAGLFHATTGYSLPCAVQLADMIAALDRDALRSAALRAHIRRFSERHWQSQAFMRLLNRMMFFAGQPARRYRILERFYTLPQPLIERFYAARLTRMDQLRILLGKPPVPVLPALRAALQMETTQT